MYERNAIVLERFFNKKFGYDLKNNLKTNFNDYCELIEQLEVYKNVSDEEENIIKEYDSIADKIRETQAKQETLDKKNQQLQDDRKEIFRNIDESSDTIRKKTEIVNNSINKLNNEIEENSQKFVEIITEFNEKSTIRTTCERNRRKVENEYNKKLNQTLDNFQDIEKSLVNQAKKFSETDTEGIEKELTDKIEKNGEKEKIPFNEDVISKAIILAVDIHKKETDLLTSIYDKMSRLFNEIKNNTVKIDKHKKTVKDSKVKLEFLSVLKEYLVQFLDNERITAVNGEKEHKSLMKEACRNLDLDLKQVNNLYSILLKEISNKVGKKTYDELYNYNYLIELEETSKAFDEKVKKLNLPVTVINPNYWRIDGMRKIYETFDKNVTEHYGRDLSKYNVTEEDEEDDTETDVTAVLKEDNIKEEKNEIKEEENEEKLDPKSEIDKKIEMILGLSKRNLREEIKKGREESKEDTEEDEEFEKENWEEDSGLDDDLEELDLNETEEIIDEEINNEEDNWGDDSDLEEFDFGEEDDFEEDNNDTNVDEFDEVDEEEDEWEEDDEEDKEEEFENETNLEETEEDDNWDDEEIAETDWDDNETDEEDFWNDNDWDDEEDDDKENTVENKLENQQSTPDVDIWGKSIKKNTKEDNWENEFINIKEKSKKKKGFFNKFKNN